MNLKSPKAFWVYVISKYHGCERSKNIEALNLIKEEVHIMKDTETIKGYANRLLSIANKGQLLGKDFPDERTVEKILDTYTEKYELKISTLEESKDLPTIALKN